MTHILMALGYAFCWGVGTSLAKLAMVELSPLSLLVIQLLASVLFLYGLCYWQHRTMPLSWRSLRQGVAGIFEPALAYLIGIVGLSLTTASNATLISATEVILTILFAALFLGERLTLTKTGLALISFIGVLLLMGGEAETQSGSWLGDLLVLAGTVFAVVYVLISKFQIEQGKRQRLSPLQLTAVQQLTGLIVTVVCVSLVSLVRPDWEVSVAQISLNFWLLAVSSGILQYGLAFWLYLTVLQSIPVSQAAFFLALIPVFGVASAMVLLGEHPAPQQWLGGILVIGTSYWGNRVQAG